MRAGRGLAIPVALLERRPDGEDSDPQVMGWRARHNAAQAVAAAAGVDRLTLRRLRRERRRGREMRGGAWLSDYDWEELRRFRFVDDAGNEVRL